MLGSSSPSSFRTFDSAKRLLFTSLDLETDTPGIFLCNANFSYGVSPSNRASTTKHLTSRKWASNSTAQRGSMILNDEERKAWDACRQALSGFEFNDEEEDKVLGKAFGFVHSPYWGEEREKQVPETEVINGVLNYLRSLSLSDDDLCKVLKKFPEVLGCSLEDELMKNVQILEKEWGIKGKSLRNLLLRNPKVLGYNVDCKGDCMAQCTRCWVRF